MNSNPRITPDDPRLTAFVLGELEGAERDAVAAAVAADPALEQAVEQLRADAGAVQAQLRAAQGLQLEFSALLEAQVLARLDAEAAGDGRVLAGERAAGSELADAIVASGAADYELDSAIASRALGGPAATEQSGQSTGVQVRRAPAPVDWRQGLGRDARRRIVWWSPFALPLAACFVAVATVGLMWWKGQSRQVFTPADTLAQTELADAPLLRKAAAQVVYSDQSGEPETAAPALSRRNIRHTDSAGLSARGNLFASRVWAHQRSDTSVGEPGMPAAGSEISPAADEVLLVAASAPVVQSEPAIATNRNVPYSVADAPAQPVPASAALVVDPVPVATGRPLSEQVLAGAVTLVRPVSVTAEPPASADIAVPAADTAASVAVVGVTADTAPLAAPALAGETSALVFGTAPVASAVESAAEQETDPGEALAVDDTSLTATQIATLAAAKRFSRASLAELEAAAFASDGNWQPDSVDITAAAAEIARSVAPQVEASAPSQVASLPVTRRPNLASRYVQAKLWVEAGQLPSVSDVDVDAIVRDAAQAYMPASLRRVRVQLAATAIKTQSETTALAARTPSEAQSPAGSAASARAPVSGSFAMPSDAAAAPAPITVQELELLEAQSLLLRQVRAYALVLKDRPVDAVARLDAIATRLRERPHIANSRNGQDFLKLLDATKALF